MKGRFAKGNKWWKVGRGVEKKGDARTIEKEKVLRIRNIANSDPFDGRRLKVYNKFTRPYVYYVSVCVCVYMCH